jgi:hypothetical protein
LKAYLRKAGERTIPRLRRRIGSFVIWAGREPNIEPWLTASAAGLELLWSAPNDACAYVWFRGPERSKLASVNTL